jgi:hypothetical protein
MNENVNKYVSMVSKKTTPFFLCSLWPGTLIKHGGTKIMWLKIVQPMEIVSTYK